VSELRRITLYGQLRDILVAEIESGALAVGGPLPTEAQLCATYGVSRVTVRRVVDELVASGLVQRERGRAAFVRARPGAAGKPNLVAFAMSNYHGPPWVDILAGVERVLRPVGYNVLVMNSDDDPAKERAAFEQMAAHPIAGVIFRPCGPPADRGWLAARLRAGLPIVMFDRYDPTIECDRVEMDNEPSSREVVRTLTALGHRRIACVHWPGATCTVVRSRRRGYEAALAAAGLPVDDSLVRPVGERRGGDVAQVVDDMLAMPDPPTAFYGFNFHLASAIVQRLRERGLRVPDDVAVVGFGDSNGVAPELLAVPLTTVQWSASDLGQMAARVLLERLTSPDAPPRHAVLPCHVVLRASSGQPRVAGRAAASAP
jgi:DNA-binding LacI/PurR family transcriptional regulator